MFDLASYHGFKQKHYAVVRDTENSQLNPEYIERLHKFEILNESEADLNKIQEKNPRKTSDFVD